MYDLINIICFYYFYFCKFSKYNDICIWHENNITQVFTDYLSFVTFVDAIKIYIYNHLIFVLLFAVKQTNSLFK